MIFIQLSAFILLVMGIVRVLELTPERINKDISGFFEKRESLQDMSRVARGKKKQNKIVKELSRIRRILTETGKEKNFSVALTLSLILMVYADEGITGTSVNKRTDFKRLIKDCQNRKIDRVIVKSVQRFARNSLECIETVRLLSECGVSVYFETDNIDTKSMNNEMFLYIKSAFAQGESLSASKRVSTSIRMRMQDGTYEDIEPDNPRGINKSADGDNPINVYLVRLPFVFEENEEKTKENLVKAIQRLF